MHLSISDASGDSAIFEYIDGKLVIHHGKQYQVMTNSPVFERAASPLRYWKQIGGSTMLPGTNRATDRFARVSYYINEATQTADPAVRGHGLQRDAQRAACPSASRSRASPTSPTRCG